MNCFWDDRGRLLSRAKDGKWCLYGFPDSVFEQDEEGWPLSPAGERLQEGPRILTYTTEATVASFTRRSIALMKTVMRRNDETRTADDHETQGATPAPSPGEHD